MYGEPSIARALCICAALCPCALGCAPRAAQPVLAFTAGLDEYFRAKSELAATIQSQLGNDANTEDYLLVALNGPSYPIGTIVTKGNTLDVESRDCVVDVAQLPAMEPWAAFPTLASERTINLEGGVPSFFEDALAEAEALMGLRYEQGRIANFAIVDVHQQLLSRQDARRVIDSDKCAEAVRSLTEAAVLVRGVLSGKETLVSTVTTNATSGVARRLGRNGRFQFTYDGSGTFSLQEDDISAKFLVLSAIRLERLVGRGPDAPVIVTFGVPSAEELAALQFIPNPAGR